MRSLLVVLCFAGCVPPPVYRVQRTARVPHASAPLRTGEPLAGPVEFSVGAPTVAEVRSPRLEDSSASVEIPTREMRGELRIRLGKHAEVAAIEEHGIAPEPIDRTQAPVGDGTVWGAGLALRNSFQFHDTPGLSIGAGLEAMRWSIPYVEYRTCVEYCDGAPSMQVLHGTEAIAGLAASLTPTYRIGPVAMFAGLYVRQHPTIVRKGEELYPQMQDADVDSGPLNWILQAGVEYRMQSLALLLGIQQDVTRDPVFYAPSISLGAAVTVPDS